MIGRGLSSSFIARPWFDVEKNSFARSPDLGHVLLLERGRAVFALASVASTIGAAVSVLGHSDRSALIFLACSQTAGVLWLFLEGWSGERQWLSATCVLAAAWIPLFLVATWIYTFSPRILDDVAPSPEPALAILSLSLFATIAAWLGLRGRTAIRQARTQLVEVDPQRLDRRWLVGYLAIGLTGLVAFMTLTGGPIQYITHLSETGSRSSGLTYVIWVALFLKYSGLTLIGHHWASGEVRRRGEMILACAILVLLAIFGQRSFLALTLVQAVLLYSLIKRPPRLRLIFPCAVLITALITFGLGTIKRYQGYRDSGRGPKVGFVNYVENRATKEAIRAYTNNYADGVRLIARARALVPKQVGYENGRGFMRLALQPIPRFLRPQVHVAKPLRPLLESSGGYTYAIPIPLAAYVERGLVGVVLGGVLLGAALVMVDRKLAKDRQRLSALLVLTTLAVEIPFCLRNSLPRGVAFATLEVLGMLIVAGTCLRGSAESELSTQQHSVPASISAGE